MGPMVLGNSPVHRMLSDLKSRPLDARIHMFRFVYNPIFRVQGLGVLSLGFRVQGFGVLSLGNRVQGLGF